MDRVALVTGAAGGIGRAIAEALAEDGRAVAVADLRERETQEVAAGIEAGGGRALGLALDVTDASSVESAVATAERDLGPVQIAVNTPAGMSFARFSRPTRSSGTG